MAGLTPKNWVNFQHYKDRCPPWIKLHKRILDDREFQRLPVASRALAPMLWLLASESLSGEFDGDVSELAYRFRQTEKEISAGLDPLIDQGFFLAVADAGNPPAGKAPKKSKAKKTAPEVSDCPHHKLIDLFVQNLPMLPKPVKSLWDGTNAENLRARWAWVLTESRSSGDRYATNEAEALDWFDRFFGYVGESDFLTGRNNKWTSCDLGWLLVKSNFAKVVQGTYVNKAT